MADENAVTMVALKGHLGYGYFGEATTLKVEEGDTFTTTSVRAARLEAKGMAERVTTTAIPVVERVSASAPSEEKIDKRTKAFKASHKK
jgi:hypothetical protein